MINQKFQTNDSLNQTQLFGGAKLFAPLIEMIGRDRVLIENHHGIVKYSSSEIVVNVNYGAIHVNGNALRIKFMNRERVIIRGCISGLQTEVLVST